MTDRTTDDDDRALDAAFAALPEPELPEGLRQRLAAIPERGNVRRFPGRSWRASAFGWAAAAAIGLFVGHSIDLESIETASFDDSAENVASQTDDEDEMLALATGSMSLLDMSSSEEEP
jgi:anti-sigma factor RsiW